MMPMSEPSLEAAAAAAALLSESLAASEPDCLKATSNALLFLVEFDLFICVSNTVLYLFMLNNSLST